jgi:hypothetical protein
MGKGVNGTRITVTITITITSPGHHYHYHHHYLHHHQHHPLHPHIAPTKSFIRKTVKLFPLKLQGEAVNDSRLYLLKPSHSAALETSTPNFNLNIRTDLCMQYPPIEV